MQEKTSDFSPILNDNETIIWQGKPEFVPFLLSGIPLLLLGVVWFVINRMFLKVFNEIGNLPLGMRLFFQAHLFPFYLGLGNFLRLFLVYKNTKYAISDKRIIHRSGFLGIDYKTIDYDQIQNLEVKINPLEHFLGLGSIKIFSGEIMRSSNGVSSNYTIFKSIKDPYDVFKKIKDVSLDIKTDWNYPNELRPDKNLGYKTKYKK